MKEGIVIKAILMAAGRGSRISREIESKCKCTLDIGGVSLIQHTVEMLLNRNIEVHIIVGFNKEQIIDCLKDYPVHFHYNAFYSVTNSLASLWFAKEELSGDCIILGNADVFWEDDLLDVLLEDKRDCVMLCDSSRVEQGDYLFKVVNDMIVDYGKGMSSQRATAEYVGIAIIRNDMIAECKKRLELLIDKQKCHDWWEQVLYSMTDERPVWAHDINGKFWAEIDYIEDYERILKYVEENYEAKNICCGPVL